MGDAETERDATQGPDAVDGLIRRVAADMVLTGEEVARYCRDWHGDVQSDAIAVLRPRTTEEVSAAVKACSDLGLEIVPRGGGTGLVRGAVPDAPERQVVLSLERMKRLRSLDPEDFTAVVEAGMILEDFKSEIAGANLFFPVSLGAQGSCEMGGIVSTNAGGLNVLRYGMTRDLVLGLEVVLPDGSVFNGVSKLRKDNRGLDLKQLFIGAEGTLGIVTAVSVKLLPLPEQTATALLALESLDAVMELYRHARRQCCDLMSAFEFLPPIALGLAQEGIPGLQVPIRDDHPAYALIELSGSGLVEIQELMEKFLEYAFERDLVADGVVAQSEAQASNLWMIRDGMNEGQARRGKHLRTDFSVPLSRLAMFVQDAEAAVEKALPGAICVSYGHVGDGNVHLNVIPSPETAPGDVDARIDLAKSVLNDVLDRHEGSISAEHGLGRLKKADFDARLPQEHRQLLTAINRAIDPASMMNPGCQIDLLP